MMHLNVVLSSLRPDFGFECFSSIRIMLWRHLTLFCVTLIARAQAGFCSITQHCVPFLNNYLVIMTVFVHF